MAATKLQKVQAALRDAGNTAAARVNTSTTPETANPNPAGDFLASKRFIAPEGTFTDTIDWSKLTVAGQPIPAHLHGLIAYELTDQAAAEREAKREYEPSGITMGADPLDKGVDKYAAGLRDDVDQWANPDPLKECAAKHVGPGERHRFLSTRKIDRSGMRGWEPKIATENGTKKMVTVGGMILATMPEERAQSRDRFFKEKAANAMVAATDKQRELNDQAASQTLGRKKSVDKGFESFRGDPGQMNDSAFSLAGLDVDK